MGQSGSRIPAKPLSKQDAKVYELKIGRDKVKRYLDHISKQKDIQQHAARDYLKPKDGKPIDPMNRERAKLALRKTKYFEAVFIKTNKQYMQLEMLVEEIKNAEQQKNIVDALEAGANALGAIRKEMGGLKHVEDVMNRSADEIANEQEISAILGEGVSAQDMDAVDEEFEKLEKEAAEAEVRRQEDMTEGKVLPAVPDSQPMPEVPKIEPQVENGTEEAVKTKNERQPMLAQ